MARKIYGTTIWGAELLRVLERKKNSTSQTVISRFFSILSFGWA